MPRGKQIASRLAGKRGQHLRIRWLSFFFQMAFRILKDGSRRAAPENRGIFVQKQLLKRHMNAKYRSRPAQPHLAAVGHKPWAGTALRSRQ